MEENVLDQYKVDNVAQGEIVKSFMSNVFSYMTLALVISGLAAYVFGTTESLIRLMYNLETGGRSIIGWIVAIAPLGLVLLMGFRYQKFSFTGMLGVFVVFSFLIGASLGSIFLAYSTGTLATTFLVTAGTFGVMALVGYTTKTDLTKLGSILGMALIGLIIAMVVNWFLQSSMMDYVISGIGVLIFTGLTAYDTQKLKRIAMTVEANSEDAKKQVIMGALSLYLDFINLFLFLLRFLGGRD
ncbi:MAG: Bax inhibitor-1/YccA family protein [Putridiphycobacter sp.]|nr:Bax inhibitor-1/YccA family protein [Putridiphycobacter sp.]